MNDQMKILNKCIVPDRAYYYLLDWKDSNMEEFQKVTGQESVESLSQLQFWNAFQYAMNFDIQISK